MQPSNIWVHKYPSWVLIFKPRYNLRSVSLLILLRIEPRTSRPAATWNVPSALSPAAPAHLLNMGISANEGYLIFMVVGPLRSETPIVWHYGFTPSCQGFIYPLRCIKEPLITCCQKSELTCGWLSKLWSLLGSLI